MLTLTAPACLSIFSSNGHDPKNNSAVKKIKKLSESPGTVPIVAKLYRNDSENRKIDTKQV